MDNEESPNIFNKNELFRNYDRNMKLQILKNIPDPFEPSENDPSKINESDIDNIQHLIDSANQGKSFIEYLKNRREFNNPENLQKVIEYYKIEEIGSNYPGDIYNPYSVVTSHEEYFDSIHRKQNEMVLQKNVIENKKP